MDNTYLIKKQTLDNIANAIRTRTSSANMMTPAQMAAAITAIPSGGGSELPETVMGASIPLGD